MVLGITKIIILAYLQMSKKGVVYTYLIFIFQKKIFYLSVQNTFLWLGPADYEPRQ